jgi:acyl-lipid omega-6 desaturase (Delta-12 desaturase)
MRSGKELILATKPFAKEVKSKSWYYTLSTLFLLLLALSAALLAPNFLLKLISGVLLSLLMVRMFVIYHDYLHHSILFRSKAAYVIMTLFGIYILAPTSIWKRSHDYHHSHNSKLFSASIGSYPIATKSKFLSMSPKERRMYLFTRHPLTILFGYFFMFVVGMCFSSFACSTRRHFDSLVALVAHVTISILVIYFLGWQSWLCAIFIPFMIACCMGAYLFYVQHNFPGVTFKCNQEWKYEIAALESSSFLVTNPLMQWVTANIGYHHIHHLNARIPFYRLPEAMAAIPELQQYKTTSLRLRDIRECFHLKVWDPEVNRMVGLEALR